MKINGRDISGETIAGVTADELAKGTRLIANKGGTRSGKTYSILKMMLNIALYIPRTFDVVSESLPHLKRGALHDFEEIIAANDQLIEGHNYELNRTDRIYSFPNGSEIRFFAADNWGKVKGSRRDILFVNEANRIDWEVFRQLDVRTTRNIIIDWNPDSEFWYEQQGLSGREDTTEIVTTYLDNPYLGEMQIAAIEAYRNDERWWKVYGLGETGNRKGLIYTDWEQCKDIPANARLVGRGLDFGYQADPTSIVAVYIMDGELYIDEELYAPGLTNDRIAKSLTGKNGPIVADSAEPKSIAELRNYGVRNIEPSVKGADSVRNGIQVVQRYKLHVTQRSLNIIRELRNYRWAEDKVTGELKNEPAKSEHFDHALDALRYLVTAKLQQRRTGTAKYNNTYLYQYGQ